VTVLKSQFRNRAPLHRSIGLLIWRERFLHVKIDLDFMPSMFRFFLMNRTTDKRRQPTHPPKLPIFIKPVQIMNRLASLHEGSVAVTFHYDSDHELTPRAAAESNRIAPKVEEEESPLDQFYAEVSQLQAIIRDIQTSTQTLKQKHAEKIKIIDPTIMQNAADNIADLTTTINELVKGGHVRLETITKNTAAMKKTQEDEQHNAGVIRIQQNQHAHLLKMYMNAVKEYQAAQKENEQAYVDQTRRQIMTKMREADGSTISAERAQELALEAIEQGTENGLFQQSKDTLARIVETRNDIYRIEQSMRELNQLFQDLAVLVNSQQESMDIILLNVEASVTYVKKGRAELKIAKDHAKKGSKKFRWLLVIVFVVIMFVLALVLGATV
jgi:syntaxin 1B/2/3